MNAVETLQSLPAYIYVVLYAIAVVFGLRGAIRTTRRYRQTRDRLLPPERAIVMLLAIICWVIIGGGLYWGFLAIRSIAGFQPIGVAAAFGSALLATVILYIPTIIDATLDYVARHRGDLE